MPMPPYRILCTQRGCDQTATFKIAARWSDGVTEELKTYALSCPGCLANQLSAARGKQATCRLTTGESLDPPGIYEIANGSRDKQLTRREDLEASLVSVSPS